VRLIITKQTTGYKVDVSFWQKKYFFRLAETSAKYQSTLV